MPALTLTGWPSIASSPAIPSSTRRATVTPADPGATTTNSSPPVRATVSTSRTVSASTAATWRRTWSPARDPAASLSEVKPSTSNIATDTSLPCRWARATSSSRTRFRVRAFDSPVRGSVWAMRSNHSARSVASADVRNDAIAAAARSATATSSTSSDVPTSWSPSQPNDSTPTQASTPPPATTIGRSANVIDDPSAATHGRERVPVRSSAARWIGCDGSSATIDSNPAPCSSLIPSVTSSSRRARSGSVLNRAAIAAPEAAAPASTMSVSAPSRSVERASAAAPAERTASCPVAPPAGSVTTSSACSVRSGEADRIHRQGSLARDRGESASYTPHRPPRPRRRGPGRLSSPR